jgi:hypothetical protein
MNLSQTKPMPTLMTLIDKRRPFSPKNRRRPHWSQPWILLLIGIAFGWLLHHHLS